MRITLSRRGRKLLRKRWTLRAFVLVTVSEGSAKAETRPTTAPSSRRSRPSTARSSTRGSWRAPSSAPWSPPPPRSPTQLGRDPLAWVLAALVLIIVVVVITLAVNVPLNDAIKAAGDPDAIDVARVREQFHESRWAAWNLLRVGASLAAFACLAWALVLEGRSGD